MFRQHGGLKENGPQAHVLGWSPVGDAVWEGLGGVGPDQPAAQSPPAGLSTGAISPNICQIQKEPGT